MANIPGQILFQTNNDAWFTTNAAIVFDDGEIIYHEDGRYKLADGVTALSALTFRGAGGSATWGGITGTLSNQTDLQTVLNNKEPLKGSDDNYVTDAQLVVIGNTSGTNSGDNAANTTSNAYADGKVADSITNGVTTIAPSQNAVFDALALKAPYPLWEYYSDGSQVNPADGSSYYSAYINNAVSTINNTVRFLSTKTNTIFSISVNVMVSSTLGSSELSTVKLINITAGTEETIGTITHNRRLNIQGGITSLANAIDDELIVKIENPTWATNPLQVWYTFSVKAY